MLFDVSVSMVNRLTVGNGGRTTKISPRPMQDAARADRTQTQR
jgi:hypothetical protein